ncbi:hypothetical protein P885DRAFT_79178 [Corynascus similis CBS 632.67]
MKESQNQSYHHHNQPAWTEPRPSRRLKDSCDMCSASKVRCDRQKPICGRCEKLAYPCFYSPARRVGRPQGRSTQQRHRRTNIAVRTEREPESAPNRQVRFPSPLETTSPLAPGLRTPPAPTRQENKRYSDPVVPRSSSTSSSCSSSLTVPPKTPTDCDSDCVELAASTQRQLESAHSQLSAALAAASSPWAVGSVQSAEAAMQTAGAAMRCMSTTLICPCSENLETGILVSATCLAVLDLYSTIVRRFTVAPVSGKVAGGSAGHVNLHRPPLAKGMMLMLPSFTDSNNGGGDDDDGGDSSSGNPGLLWDEAATKGPFSSAADALHNGRKKDLLLVHVLGELGKLATVVYQFINRYRAGPAQQQQQQHSTIVSAAVAAYSPTSASEAETEILRNLAGLLKRRLKATGDETAAMLQMAPSTVELDKRIRRDIW